MKTQTYADAHPTFVANYLDRDTAETRARRAGCSVRHVRAGGLDLFEVHTPAPLPTFADALELARAEYGYRRSSIGAGYYVVSRGADGGMHHRGDARTLEQASQWCEQRARELARDMASGAVLGSLLFWDGSRWYLG